MMSFQERAKLGLEQLSNQSPGLTTHSDKKEK